MTKFKNFLFAIPFALCLLVNLGSDARLFEDKCNPTPKCEAEVECYGCAPNKPMRVVDLSKCAHKNKPYNYYTWSKEGEKEVASDMYDWAASPEGGAGQ